MGDTITGNSGLEGRLARIEAAMGRTDEVIRRLEAMDDRLRRFEIDLAEIKGRVTQLPTAWQMFTAIVGGQIGFGALIVAALKLFGTH